MSDVTSTTTQTTQESSIRLRPFIEDDFDQMIAWAESAGFLLQWTGKNFTWPLDREQLDRYLARSRVESPELIINSVVDTDSGALIGHIGLALIDTVHSSARLSCVLIAAEAARGRGLGEAAVRAMCRVGFDKLGLHRLDLGVWELNPGAIACYEKVGFKKEGLFRDFFRVDEGDGDGYRNIYQMSILEDEWRTASLP